MLKFRPTPNKIMLLVFLIPFILRLIPELIAGYYPIGWDTPRYASTALLRDPGGLSFPEGPLFHVLLISLRTLTNADVFILIKLVSATLYGLLGLAVYYFARNYLGWEVKKSFVVVLFTIFYFVTLRISWDLFRNELGLIFLFIALPWLKKLNSFRNCLIMAILSFLIVLSHPFVAIIFFFIVGGLSLLNFIHDGNRSALKPILFALPAGIFFFVCVFLPNLLPSLTTGLRSGFLESTAEGNAGGLLFNYVLPNPWNPSGGYSALFGYVWTLFFFSYGLILFFVYKGVWREPVLGLWTFCLLIGSFSCLVSPGAAIPYVDRWMFMLIFPFSFYAVNGLEKMYAKSFSIKIIKKKTTPTTVILALFVCLAGIYVATPVHIFEIGSTNRSIPGRMLQTSINLDVIPSTIGAFEWLNTQVDNNSCIVLEQRFSGWAMIYLDENVNIIFYGANMPPGDAFYLASEIGFSKIYFLWYRGFGAFDAYQLNENYVKDKIAVYTLEFVGRATSED